MLFQNGVISGFKVSETILSGDPLYHIVISSCKYVSKCAIWPFLMLTLLLRPCFAYANARGVVKILCGGLKINAIVGQKLI